jgi:glutathione S-transferase
MYTLYYAPGTASLPVHWMLLELGIQFEAVLVDLNAGTQKSENYLKLNPQGKVPTLIIDGRPCTESAALLMLLAERHPEAGLAPLPGDPGRAEYMELMIYLANTLMPSFHSWFGIERFIGAEHQADVRNHVKMKIEEAFSLLDDKLADGRKYLLGDQMSATDFLGTLLMRWSRNMPRPATDWPNLGAYVARMRQREALREVHAREGLTDWISG